METVNRPNNKPWEELKPDYQRKIMREYETSYRCPGCKGYMRFVNVYGDYRTVVFHAMSCRFRRIRYSRRDWS